MRNVIALMLLVGAMSLTGCAEKKNPATPATPATPAAPAAGDAAKPAETPAK
jgi:hypothetical protein